MVMIAVRKIEVIANPFDGTPWDCSPVTREMVDAAIAANELQPMPFDPELHSWDAEAHAQRIAYLVVNGFSDPISLDVGIPNLGYCPSWIVCDGNHRLAAAIYQGTGFIEAEVSGAVDHIAELFDVEV